MMTRRTLLPLLISSGLPLVAQPATSASGRPGLQSLVDKVSVALNAKDVKAFGSCFTEDGEFTNPIGTTIKGRAAIEAFHARLFSPTRFLGTPSFFHVTFKVLGTSMRMIRPDVAVVDVKWEQDGAIAPDGSDWGARKGMMTWVAVRGNAAWSIAVWHNMELPKSF